MLSVWVWLAFCAFIAVGTLVVVATLAVDIAMAVRDPRAGWAAFKRWAIGDLVRWRGRSD